MKEELEGGVKVELQEDEVVKFISPSGIEVFVENKEEDQRQEALLLMALGNIDGADTTKLASFLKKHNKPHIYNYLAKNRPNLKLEKMEVVKQEKGNEEKKEVKIENPNSWRKRFFKKKVEPLNHESPIEKAVKSRRKWYKSYKSLFLKKGELTKNEQKKVELLSNSTAQEAKKHVDKSPLKIAMDLGMDKEVAKMIDEGYVLKKSELKDLTKEAMNISSNLIKKRTVVEKISGSLSKEQLKTLADVRKHLLRDESHPRKKVEVIETTSKRGRKIENSLQR